MKILAAIAIALTCNSAALAQIQWTATLDAARKRSATQQRVLFIAVTIDGQRDSDAITATHYRDRMIAKLAAKTVNVFCSVDTHKKKGRCKRCKSGTCADHRTNEQKLKSEILKLTQEEPIRPPLHVFVAPDGKVIASAAGFVTAGELEWMFVDSIREVEPTFEWQASGRVRAPASFKRGTAVAGELTSRPPSEQEVDEALDAIRKLDGGRGGRGGFLDVLRNAQKNSRLVVRSTDKSALDWGKATLRGYRRFRNGLLKDIGRLSPKPWGKVVAEWLDDKSDETRKTAAIALFDIRDSKAAGALRKAIRTETDKDVLGRMLRALAVSAPTNNTAITTVTNSLKSHAEAIVRAHATVAVGLLEKGDPVAAGLKLALQDTDPMVRAVAAYVIATRQDRPLSQHLSRSAAGETDATAKAWMDKAVAALKSGDPAEFDGFLAKILDGDAPGDRLEELQKFIDDLTKPDKKKDTGDKKK